MAWTDPNTYIAGAILTAAQLNAMQANALAGGPIYATEAARNTAIPSPFEGQRAYITAPTEPSGTGMTITGIQTIYNGAAWTTVSTICGLVTTSEACSSIVYADLATVGPTVAIRTGTAALVTISATINTVAANRGGTMSFVVSGASAIAATNDNGIFAYSSGTDVFVAVSRSYLLTGLTAGVNTFTSKYLEQGGTVNFMRRSITVQGVA